jgi:hypothetical protein
MRTVVDDSPDAFVVSPTFIGGTRNWDYRYVLSITPQTKLVSDNDVVSLVELVGFTILHLFFITLYALIRLVTQNHNSLMSIVIIG